MVIFYNNKTKEITITPENDESVIFDWIFARVDGNDLFNFTLRELINQRRVQMNHDEKEAVYALYTLNKNKAVNGVVSIDSAKVNNNPIAELNPVSEIIGLP